MPTTKKKPAAKKKTTSPATNSGTIVIGPYRSPCTMEDGLLREIVTPIDGETSPDRVQVFYNLSSARAAVRRTEKATDEWDFCFARLTS